MLGQPFQLKVHRFCNNRIMDLFVFTELWHYDKLIATFCAVPPKNLSKTFTFIICKYYEFPCETHIRKYRNFRA